MQYLSYAMTKAQYTQTQSTFEEILNEKERLFARTQPKAETYDKERVSASVSNSAFDDYIIAKESKQIDNRLNEVKSLLDDRGRLLALKENELRHSKEVLDKVYCLKYLDKNRPYLIAYKLNFSERQIYRFLGVIEKSLKSCHKMS